MTTTTSGYKPASSSSSELTPATDSEVRTSKKRQTPPDSGNSIKRPKVDKGTEKGIYCHQCHNRCKAEDYLRCTRLKSFGKNQPLRACNIAWCGKDLIRKYNIEVHTVKSQGPSTSKDHDTTKGYQFSCPCCTESCQCAQCRKKKGLMPLGPALSTFDQRVDSKTASKAEVGSQESIASTLLLSTKRDSLVPATIKRVAAGVSRHQRNDSSTFPADSSSELSDPPPKPSLSVKKVKNKGNTVSTVKREAKAKSAAFVKADNTKPKLKRDPVDPVKRKTPAPKGEVKKTPLPKKESRKPINPPAFDRIDTRLSRTDAEDRLGLREFLFRFRANLSIPERNLTVLDDFDRPLTESSVRLFAGALLDPIKRELEEAGDDLKEDLFNMREELRYYADLVRFASIFNTLKRPLGLRISRPPPALASEEAKVRALLDLDPTQPTPSWAVDGPARRSASKVPTHVDVVQMLLALADRAMLTPQLRAELESTTGESKARKLHATTIKQENTKWEGLKKKLAEAKVLCKTPSESKANQKKHLDIQREYTLHVAMANVNLRASLHVIRHEPLGKDLDGRTYYALRHRLVNDDTKAPIGWASGLLVWGPVPATTKDDTLSGNISRWSHFGNSRSVKALVSWLDWRRESTIALKPRGTPRKSNVEVVIPQRTRRECDSDSDSVLSSVPDDDLLEMLDPIGYAPRHEEIVNEMIELGKKLVEVAEWLEVLEWKGLGENQ